MSVAPITLYVNADDQILVRSQANPGAYTVPTMFQGDTVPLEFQLLYRSDVTATTLVNVPSTGYSLQVILVSTAGTTLAYQNTFTDDSSYALKIGSISLNTAAIDAAITAAGSAGQITAYLQIKVTYTDGTTRTVYFQPTVTIQKTYLTAATTAVPPSETAATESWVRGTFFPKSGTSGGDVKIMESEGGYQFRFYVDDDGVPHFDRIN